MSLSQYHSIIRKTDIAFSSLFDSISIAKYNEDGTENKRLIVPLIFADKELFVQRLNGDPDLAKSFQISLPQLSWEKLGMSYNAKRKLNSAMQNYVCIDGVPQSYFSPLPYDLHYNLYVYTRNMEETNQVLEFILPYFSPDYTLRINLIDEIGLIKEFPVILNATTTEFVAQGVAVDAKTRTLITTLSFTIQSYIFGEISTPHIIKHVIQDMYMGQDNEYTIEVGGGNGSYKDGEVVYTGMSISNYGGKATVTNTVPIANTANSINITNNVLYVSSVSGSFTVGSFLKGSTSLAMRQISKVTNGYDLVVRYRSDVTPANSTPLDNFTIVESLQEFPDIT